MGQLIASGTVIPGSAGVRVDVSDVSRIIVGALGSTYRIEYDLGGANIYKYPDSNIDGIVLEKAAGVTIHNTGAADLIYEVYA